MKRHGGLWETLVSFENLLRAFRNARRGKRLQANVANFEFHLERELFRLQRELKEQTYTPGGYRTFMIREPKPRLISAAPFRDRVVHHALYNVLAPIYERVFIFDNYACRKDKGTHAAVRRFNSFARRNRYVLKCDVRKYFPSIDHEVLKSLLARKIKDRNVLWLACRIIDHSNAQEPVADYFPGDDLFTPFERRKGLPLGNQTSQFFANVYLDPLDHFVKETLRARCYLRYVDDFVILHNDAGWLADSRGRCREFLQGLRLRLHPNKAVISRVEDGTRLLGYRVFPDHRLLPRENVVGFRRRLRRLQDAYADRQIDWSDVQRSLAGWLGHARQADTWILCEDLLGDTIFVRR